jgi:hypothetical protein
VGAGWTLQRNPGAFVVKEVLPLGLAVVVALAVWAVVAVVAVGAGQPGASAAIAAWVNRQVVHRFPIALMDAVKVAVASLAAGRSRNSGRCILSLRCPIALSAM